VKIAFWLSAITILISEFFLLMGFVNVYFKNYNGGSQSSSGSIIYPLLLGIVILIAGFYFYVTGKLKIATTIMSLPIIIILLYLLIVLILPYLRGERMN